MKIIEKNMKKQQKTDYFESTTKPSLFSGEPANSRTLICKNKPNYEHLGVNITVCKKKVYKDFSLKIYQKNKPNTNPNKANFKTPKTHFSAELFSDTRLRQGVPAGCKNWDWLVPAEGRVVPVPFFATAVQRSSRRKKPLKTRKPLDISGEPALLRNLFLRNEPNLSSQKSTATSCSTMAYNASQPKPKNGTNPNEPNFFTTPKPNFSEELFSVLFSPPTCRCGCVYITTNPIFVRSFGQVQGLDNGQPEAYWCTSRIARQAYNAVVAKRTTKITQRVEDISAISGRKILFSPPVSPAGFVAP